MRFKIGKKSLTKISLVIMLILFTLMIVMIPSSTKSSSPEQKSIIEAPKIIGNQWSRKITVYSDDTQNYYNVPISMIIPENLIEIELYRYLDSSLMKKVTNDPAYDFQVVDSDGNGLTDMVKWVVPELSEVSFSVAGRSTEGLSILTKIPKESEDNKTKTQFPAEIGKPVKWKMRVETTNESIAKESIPKDAKNIISGEIVTTNIKTYEIEYETSAPYKEESEYKPFVSGEKYRKKVIVKSNFSEHYENVKAFTDIPEELSRENYTIKLYHNINGSKTDVTDNPEYAVSFVDSDYNIFIDRLEWFVPELSEQEFEIEASLTIINVQSFPTLGGNWTVRFNTTGTADLTITAVDGAEFGRDILFLELKCGDNILTTELTDDAVFVEDYSCDEIGYEISKVLISGKHTLEFRFGNDIKYAYNNPGPLEFYYNESLSESTTTSTSYQDKVSITFTPSSTKNYTILAYTEMNSSSTSYEVNVNLSVDGTTYQETMYRPKDPLDIYTFSTLKKIELSNTEHTVQISYRSSSGSATAKIINAKLIVIAINPEYNESESQSTTQSTTQSEKIRLVFTPSSSSEYLIIASANIGHSNTGDSVRARLYIDGVEYANSLIEPVVATPTSYYTFGVFKNVTFGATQHVINLTWNNDDNAATTAYIKYAHLAAIRLSDFSAYYYNESEPLENPVTNNVWYNKTPNSYTAQNGEHLIMYTTHRTAGTGRQIRTRLVNDSTTQDYSSQESNDNTDFWAHFWFTKASLSAGAHEDIAQYSIPSGTTTNFGAKLMRIISIQLNTSVSDITPPTYSLNSTNSTLAGTPVLHSLNWTDNSGLSGYIFSFDSCTGSLTNDTWVAFISNTWSNVTKTINSTSDCTIRWCVYANDTNNNWNGTSCENPFSYVTTSVAECSVAIGLSDVLADGITFGSVTQGETKDAIGNNGAGVTRYNITVQISGCTPSYVDIYIKANDFTNGSYTIALSNEKFRNSTTNTVLASLTNVSLSTTWILIGDDLADSESIYLKYLLTVPSPKQAGFYNNTVNIWSGRNDLTPS